jgi:hypothetical protein
MREVFVNGSLRGVCKNSSPDSQKLHLKIMTKTRNYLIFKYGKMGCKDPFKYSKQWHMCRK